MKATDFVIERGIDRVKELVNECPDKMLYIGKCGFSKLKLDEFACKKDLKKIIEAWELVERFGGMSLAKDKIKGKSDFELTAMEGYLKQAINLVEQCND